MSAEQLWLFVGRFHPLAVHFPIALLVVAALLELARSRRDPLRPAPAAFACLWLGALAAAAAAALGWSSARTAGYGGSAAPTLELHRWLGVCVPAAALIAAILASLARTLPRHALLGAYRSALLVAAILVAVAAHFGGSLVHGPDYLDRALAILRDGTTDAPLPDDRRPGADPLPDPLAGPRVADLPAADLAPPARDPIIYERDVKPILARHCFRCHSASGDAPPEHGLALDSRDAALRGGDSGVPAIIPGDAARSRLISLVSGAVPDARMPPKGAPLSDDHIALLRAWIDQGASYADPVIIAATPAHEDGAMDPTSGDAPSAPTSATHAGTRRHWHWAYNPPARPNPPHVRDTDWPRNPIDAFVLARLESLGLTHSPEADRVTLLRRLSLDLIGLPPTPAEVDAFLADSRHDAYERAVDRLLDSPRYGEHWARRWLDLARYADTHGYEKDNRRDMWLFRDWVIDALNRDLPFDQFTIHQLAGDLLPAPTIDQRIATGFHRNTMINEEGGVDVEEFRVDAVVDRVNTTATVWLGTTLACAQCHDHKADPFSQDDYYRFFAFFNNSPDEVSVAGSERFALPGELEVLSPQQHAQREVLLAQAAAAEAALRDRSAESEARVIAWEARVLALRDRWRVLVPDAAESRLGSTLSILPDGSVLASGDFPDRDEYAVEAVVDLPAVVAVRLELLPDPALPRGGPGRAPNGNLVLTDFRAEAIVPAPAGSHALPARWARVASDFDQPGTPGFPAAHAADTDPLATGWAVDPRINEAHEAIFVPAEPLRAAAGPDTPTRLRLRFTLSQHYGARHTIGRFRLSVTDDPAWTEPHSPLVPPAIADLIASDPALRTQEIDDRIRDFYIAIAPEHAPARDALAAARAGLAAIVPPRAMILRERDHALGVRPTHLLIRGNFLNPAHELSPGVPAVLGSLSDPAADPAFSEAAPAHAAPRPSRLDLARWLVRADNPLTARVTANRAWEAFFGRGIVETSDDFGTQGEPPSHPELLDWLATELVRGGWSLKHLHRVIVTSATYRQSSRIPPDLLQLDPANRLLARAPRFRLDAEAIRDAALHAAGLLSPRIGGPSVFPPQPDGVWNLVYNADRWITSTGEDRYRRGLYTFLRRTAPYPAFMAFDASSREISCPRRPRTNTPIQALAALNDPALVEAAVALARRAHAESPPDPPSRISRMFRLVLSRAPDQPELSRLLLLYDAERESFRADPAAAALLNAGPQSWPVDWFPLAGSPDTAPPDTATPDAADLAALSVVANVLLNLDEAISKE